MLGFPDDTDEGLPDKLGAPLGCADGIPLALGLCEGSDDGMPELETLGFPVGTDDGDLEGEGVGGGCDGAAHLPPFPQIPEQQGLGDPELPQSFDLLPVATQVFCRFL